MKTKSRNLLTVLLAMLCAVAVAIGVGFALPKNEKSATAATATSVSSTDIDVSFGNVKSYYKYSLGDVGVSFNSMSSGLGSVSSGVASGGAGGGTVSLICNKTSTVLMGLVVYPVVLKLNVPAHTVFTIEFSTTFNFGLTAGCAAYISENWTETTAADVSSGNFSGSFAFTNMVGIGYRYWTPPTPMSGGDAGGKLIMYNDTASDKDFYAYNMYVAEIRDGDNASKTHSFNFTINNFVISGVKIGATTAVTTTPAAYDGSSKFFSFNYSTPSYTEGGISASYTDAYKNILPTVKSAEYSDGSTIASSTYEIENLDTDGTPTSANGTFKAIEAGTYKIAFNLTSDAIANGVEWTDGGIAEKTLEFTINRKAIPVPTIQNSTPTYKGAEYDNFTLLNYDKDLMSVASYTSNNGSSISWDNTAGAEKFKATDAAEYTVKFHLDSKNHIWSVDGGESATDQSKTITINKKEISINTTPAANSNPSWDFGAAGNIEVTATASGISNPDFVLNIYYVLNTAPADPITTGWDGTTNKLDVSQIAGSGEYTLCAELTSAAANKNYKIANDKFEMPFTIGAGAIDFSVINWTYKEGSGNATPLYNGTQLAELLYKQDENGNAIKYYISANIPAGGYLSIDTSYNSNGFKDGFYTTSGGQTVNDGCTAVGTYKTRVALISDSDHTFKSTANSGSFGGDDTKGWYEIEWKIEKGKVDPDYFNNLNKYLQYRPAGGAWTEYDPDNPPQFGSGAVEIRLDPAKYADGITAAEVTVNNKQTAIGKYTATVKFTYDPSYENEGNKSFEWQIGAMVIDVDWTSDSWIKNGETEPVVDGNNVPYQIRVLNIKDDLKQYIEYKYYIANSDLTKGTYIGTGDAGLQDLISPPYNASSTNAVYVYVEAVIKSGVTQYTLKDDTGNDYTNCMLFQLGATNTLVKVSLTETEMQYGENKLTAGIIDMFDTGVNGQLDQSAYVEGIYVYNAKGDNLGLLSAFDASSASVGVYTIKIVLNAAGEDTYTLSPGSTLKFTIKPKAIAVPTVKDITFNNRFVNFADYLGGSWEEYKDIIKLGGTVDGVKNAGTYSATLTLLDSNYCWDYSKGIKPVKYALASDEMTCTGDDTVATYDWKIAPYVLKASSWNLKGKEGAVYNIPAELTDGLDVDINYLYHPDKTSSPLGDGESLTAGSTYFVKAQLIGADRDNFVFEDSKTTTSDFATYKLSQSAGAAFLNNVKNFMTKVVAGLPVWAWLLIALAVLILLIIIIVVACKRRKSKEEKEEIKARKEEERLRKEEEREAERQRREEERQAQKERLEAERELAKAKQEAELEKIRAQAGMAAGAGMATMAVQQQPQQQVPVQQVQTVDNELLKEMRQQMAELRADNKQTQAQLQALQNSQPQPAMMPMPQQPMYQQYPMYQQMPMQMPMAMPNYGGGDNSAIARMEAQLNAMQAEQRARYDAEQRIELAAMRAEQHVDRDSRHSVDLAAMREHINGYSGSRVPDYSAPAQPAYNQPNSVDMLGALVAATLKNMANGTAPAAQPQPQPVPELPQKAEQGTPVTAKYPSDAVITTTTTVDTTKAKPIRREEDTNFDIDGFYDPLD